MSHSFKGGCACGQIRYEISAEPIAMNDCHCRHCQHDSGTGHGSYLTFPRAAVTLRGDASHWLAIGDLGTKKKRGFCPNCGSPVYVSFPDIPDIFIVTAGSLDDLSQYKPDTVIWTKGAHIWDSVHPDAQQFEKMPPM